MTDNEQNNTQEREYFFSFYLIHKIKENILQEKKNSISNNSKFEFEFIFYLVSQMDPRFLSGPCGELPNK